jgi:ATP-dependent protease Clp ATPase subunit
MYNLPSSPDISKVVIDDAVIQGKTDPILIFDQISPGKKASKD